MAEMGAAFLCADLQITPTVRRDDAAYIQSWLKVLKNDDLSPNSPPVLRRVLGLIDVGPDFGPPGWAISRG
jgi:hypothetical protein